MVRLSGLLGVATLSAQVVYAVNPYAGWNVWVSPSYASEVNAAAALVTDATLKAKMAKVALVPTFTWIDKVAKTADLPGYLSAANNKIFQMVVYDLPDHDCAAAKSNSELSYSTNGAALYQAFIDNIVRAVQAAPTTRVVAIVEPNSLANVITNLNVARCASVMSQYKNSIVYALSHLAAANVYCYLDGSNAGVLGWPANVGPAAQMYAQIRTAAGGSAYIRGLATDVAGYDALSTPTPSPASQGNPNYDELHFIQAIAPLLVSNGWNAQFIVDQSRSGVQNIGTTWCNRKGAGFGTRPTTSTGSALIDSIVWVKRGGESDGTSNIGSPNYQAACATTDAKTPSPEAGAWFQAYFVDLVNFASPSF